jgi:hypothetical protein
MTIDMRWILREDVYGEEEEWTFDSLGEAINFVSKWSEADDDNHYRIRLFVDTGNGGDHVATYYAPKKGYWT